MPVVSVGSLHELIKAIFVHLKAPDDLADEVAEVLVDNSLAGHDSHGILRVPQYVDAIRAGRLDPSARPQILEESVTTALVTGNNTFGQVAADFAADLATKKALSAGVAAVSLVRTGHTGRLAAFTERASRRGVAMFMTVGTVGAPVTAPYGGRDAVFGTNPVSFSMPNPGGTPVTLDYATSAIAMGKVKIAQVMGQPLPKDVALDRDRNPTTAPDAVLDQGVLLPFGFHKGYGLAVIAELFATAMTGADERNDGGQGTGAFFLAVDASAFRGLDSYARAVTTIVERFRSVVPSAGFDKVRVPGDRETEQRANRVRDGIPVPPATLRQILELTAEFGIESSFGSAAEPDPS